MKKLSCYPYYLKSVTLLGYFLAALESIGVEKLEKYVSDDQI